MVNVECRCLAMLDYVGAETWVGERAHSWRALVCRFGAKWIDDNNLGPSVLTI